MIRIFIPILCISFAFCNGFVKVFDDSWRAKLESPAFGSIFANANTQNNTCEVFINNKKVISGEIKKNQFSLELLGFDIIAKGKINKNFVLKLNNNITFTATKDVGENTHISISDGTKIIIRKNQNKDLKITSNALVLYQLLMMCIFAR